MARVKYHGVIPVLFHDLQRGPVKPEEEFDVPDDEKERYTRRDDIEDLEPDPEPEPEAPKVEAPTEEPATEATEGTETAPTAGSPVAPVEPPTEAAPPTE